MKIFQIGFNKCGTASLEEIFKNHTVPKLNTIHWDKNKLAQKIYENYITEKPLLEGYENFDYYGDMQYQLYEHNIPKAMILPYISMFMLLDNYYVGSKFILNTRNIDNWLRSRINWRPGNDNEFYMKAYGIKDIDQLIEIYKKQWYSHHNIVKSYFAHRSEDLLVFDIEQDDIDKLKKFFVPCNILITADKMPRLNKS